MKTETANLMKIVDANIVATHAYEVSMAAKSGKPFAAECWSDGGLSSEQLQALVTHQKALLATPAEHMKAWAAGGKSAFDPARDLQPLLDSKLKASATNLPVNVYAEAFKERAPKATLLQRKALASLLQMMLDVERDADVLQNMFRLYVGLGLPVYMGQLGLADGTDAELLVLGKDLSPRMCPCPFATDAATLQMMGVKMHNWGRRHTGERDKTVVAREMLAEDDVKALVPLIRKMPAQKIAVIGHSFTMDVHWASPSAFVPIASEILKAVNPKVEIRQWQGGGLTASRAYSREETRSRALCGRHTKQGRRRRDDRHDRRVCEDRREDHDVRPRHTGQEAARLGPAAASGTDERRRDSGGACSRRVA